MLGDVGQPDEVGRGRGERTADEVVMDRHRLLAGVAAPSLAGRGRPHLLLAAKPVHAALTGSVAGGGELVGDKPVAELGLISVNLDDRVREMRVCPVAVADRLRLPLVERLG